MDRRAKVSEFQEPDWSKMMGYIDGFHEAKRQCLQMISKIGRDAFQARDFTRAKIMDEALFKLALDLEIPTDIKAQACASSS